MGASVYPVPFSYQSYARMQNNTAVSVLSSLASGRYEVLLTALFYNLETVYKPALFNVVISVNGDNDAFDTTASRSWSTNVPSLAPHSVTMVMGTVQVSLNQGSNNKVEVRSGLANSVAAFQYTTQHVALLTLSYHTPR